MRLLRRVLVLVLVLVLVPAWQAATADTTLLLSYEALPSAQLDLPKAKAAPYADKLPLGRAVAAELVPAIVAAAGLDPAKAATRVGPGGYMLETNPSLQTRIAAKPEAGERLAAALGYVLRQEGVLVSDLHAADGDSYQVTIRFRPGTLTPARAHDFFRRAAEVERGLGGGYSALGDDLIFLNLRGGDGRPLSGLSDPAFLAGLAAAADRFPDARVLRSGKARARLVENDWKASPDGADYARMFAAGALAELDRLRVRHTALVRAQAKRQGWE